MLAYDSPGCGGTSCSDLTSVDIPFLVATAEQVLDAERVGRFHLAGHSMGGLTALLIAERHPERIASFTDIEGNLAPEDCFLTRRVITHPADDPDKFLADFADRVSRSPHYASGLYSQSVRHKVRARAVRSIFESMVELSDQGDLIARFLALPFPKMFLYGAQNGDLSYLPELAEIPHSAHFPMYSNPPEMWQRITLHHPR